MKYLHTLALEQKENAKHGETTFPIQKYITNLTEPGQVVTTHWHEEAEFTLITGGTCLTILIWWTMQCRRGIYC